MLAKHALLLLFLSMAGCGWRPPASARPPEPRLGRPTTAALSPSPVATPGPSGPASHRAQLAPDHLTTAELEDERQIAVLRKAISLYAQFLERADGRPELAPAVQKSQERIADAQATIEFLEAGIRARRTGTETEPRL